MSSREILFSAAGVSTGTPTYIEDVFSTYLYTGNSSVQTITNGIQLNNSFSPGTTGGSGVFNGINNYLSVPTGTALNLSGDFTIEAFVNISSYTSYPGIFSNGDYPNTAQVVFTTPSGYPYLYMADGTNWAIALGSSVQVPLNTWTHIAVTCSGSTFTIWVNGQNRGTATASFSRTSPSSTSIIGRLYPSTDAYYYDGYISNFRIVKGTALYTANFTPPSTALTAVSGTQLLCLQGASPFVDNSVNGLTITNNNSVSASSFGPMPYITNIGKGGLVWVKDRSVGNPHCLQDTTQGTGVFLRSSSTAAATAVTDLITSFNNNGFTVGADATYWAVNKSPDNYVSWTFAEQEKFFDVVTYTGDGVAGRTVSHNLGSVPGMIIIKATSTAGYNWNVYHRSLGATKNLVLQTTAAAATSSVYWNDTAPTSTEFTLGTNGSSNASGVSYVAYLFAHNAGGFGTSGTDNVISCGSFTGDSTVTLGYEPQYVMFKRTDSTGNWRVLDNMRGMPVIASSTGSQQVLFPNTSGAESTDGVASPTATGFQTFLGAGTYIYMAIRRPMKVPTTGTSVFSPNTYTEVITNPTVLTSGFATDLNFQARNNSSPSGFYWSDRLRGSTPSANNLLTSSSAAAETTFGVSPSLFDSNTGIIITEAFNNTSGATDISYQFARRPGFFDEVCYAGQASNDQVINHNLTVPPELIISKARNSANEWWVYSATQSRNKYGYFNNSGAFGTSANIWGTSNPTATTYNINSNGFGDAAGVNVVAYLFATCPGVSKVGSYTGTGATQTINCGFTGGARFVLIKRTDSTGDWWVWDTVRGMVAGTDPKLALNSTSAETNANWVYTTTTGFQIVTTDASVNASGGTYIYLAIA